MPAPTGSKRAATMAFASPAKAGSKRFRTEYDYGDEDDIESSSQDPWNADNDSDSMGVGDGSDSFCGEPGYRKDAITTGVSETEFQVHAISYSPAPC